MATRGKDFVLQREDAPAGSGAYTTVGGLRPTSFTINTEQIDTTSKDGDNWRDLLAGGIQSMSVSGGGIFENDTVIKAIEADKIAGTFWNYRLIDSLGTTFDAQFQITSWGRSGEYTGALEYSISLESNGAVTHTPV